MHERLQARRLAADTLRRAVWRDEFGILGLDRFQAFEKLIEFEIGNFGFGVLVIKVVVPVDLGAEIFWQIAYTGRIN